MPRKPLDGREHGGRLLMSGGTLKTRKSAPLGALFGLCAKRSEFLSCTNKSDSPKSRAVLSARPTSFSSSPFAALFRGGAPAPLGAHKAHEHRPRSGSEFPSSEMLRRRRSDFFPTRPFGSAWRLAALKGRLLDRSRGRFRVGQGAV